MGSCGCAEAAAASLVQAHARARGVLSCPCWPLAHAHAAAAARHRLARAHERAQQATHSAAALEVRVGAAGDARARARARRYKALHGKFVLHPLDGRRVPIITDAVLVDMAFGTGAVKITPAHDPNDFEAGLRHRGEGVEFINILADDGTINARGGRFAGQPRFQARAQD